MDTVRITIMAAGMDTDQDSSKDAMDMGLRCDGEGDTTTCVLVINTTQGMVAQAIMSLGECHTEQDRFISAVAIQGTVCLTVM